MQNLSGLRNRRVIRDIDLELCRFLRDQHSNLSEGVLLAACLVSYLYGQGDVCLLLEKYASQQVFDEDEATDIKAPDLQSWRQSLADSPVVGAPGDFKPLILDKSGRLYLHKLWHYENNLAEHLVKRSHQQSTPVDVDLLRDGLQRLFPASTEEPDWQKVAAATSVKNRLSIISGGPGTGKTSTVVRVLALLLEQVQKQDQTLNIALTAPTGKAAARLKDSILTSKDEINIGDEIREAIPDEAMTLHQLLGARRHTSRFMHDEENPVPYDVVIVDEASMVDQAMMSKLVNALLKDARLILLGDKDQLASVEAGSVLGDICDPDRNRFSRDMAGWLSELSLKIPEEFSVRQTQSLIDNITLLTKSYRFDEKSGIGQLSSAINAGDEDRSVRILTSDNFTDASISAISNQAELEEQLRDRMTGYFNDIIQSNSIGDALKMFNNFQILSAHRRGPWGVEFLNQLVEKILQQQGFIPKYERWYPGKPVIVNVNDYTLGLYNGDTGVCLADEDGQLSVHFRHEDSVRSVVPGRLPDHDTAYALTVHKSQGSEFQDVLFILPNSLSKVLSRELVYTAITRARNSITILGNESVFRQCISKKLQRSSGLRDQLWRD
jgi:exodeoxyribonuclease V alpha subunit